MSAQYLCKQPQQDQPRDIMTITSGNHVISCERSHLVLAPAPRVDRFLPTSRSHYEIRVEDRPKGKIEDGTNRKDEEKPNGKEIDGLQRPLSRCLSQVSTACSLGNDERLLVSQAGLMEEVRKYAYNTVDLGVLQRFIDLDLFNAPGIPPRTPNKEMLRLVLRAMKLLHFCDYSHEDICLILAHTSVYFQKTYAKCGMQMDSREIANAAVLQMFIAHSYTLDETCPLSVWHQHLFAKYCSVRTLNSVVIRLLNIRGYRLKLEHKDMTKRYRFLLGSSSPLSQSPLSVVEQGLQNDMITNAC